MAAKTDAAVINEKPPTYEITPKRIFIYLIINFIAFVAASDLSDKFETPKPSCCYFLIYSLLLLCLCLEYFFPVKDADIPSRIYHADLLSQKEFDCLKERFEKVKRTKRQYDYLNMLLYKKEQQEYDNLKLILDSQYELRTLCVFKQLLGVQQCSAVKNVEKISTKAAAVDDRIPTYEISPKWTLIYLTVNFVLAAAVSVWSYAIDNCPPLLYYCYIYFVILLILILKYADVMQCDIASFIYHPDLMPLEEFKILKSEFKEVESMKYKYDLAKQPFPAKYQQEYDNLKPIFDAQDQLRAVCWLKKFIGLPKFIVQENANDLENESVDENITDESFEDYKAANERELTLTKEFDYVDSNSDGNVTDEKAKNDQIINSLKAEVKKLESDNADIKNLLGNHGTQMAQSVNENVVEATSEDDNVEAVDEWDFKLTKYCEFDSVVSNFNGSVADKKAKNNLITLKAKVEKLESENANIKNVLESHEAQLAQIKAENTKLKNFVETFIESQAIF